MKENSVLLTVLVIACLDTSLGKTLIGIDKLFTVKEVLYIIGPKACRHACLRRSGCVDTIYEKELLMCKLLSTSPSTIRNEDSTSKNDAGYCSSTFCNSNELCVELSQRAKCVKIDMPRDCKDVLTLGRKNNGIHVIFPATAFSVPVLCNMTLNGGGYTSVQRRIDGSINFQRNWFAYEKGFGDLESEYWIGNSVIHSLTALGQSTMYIALEDHYGVKKYAEYRSFHVDNDSRKYKLTWGDYNGTAGNSLMPDAYFSTKNQDNDFDVDYSCAISKGGSGGWWYRRCSSSALNGVYCSKGEEDIGKCNRWYTFNSDQSGMKMSEMLLRRN